MDPEDDDGETGPDGGGVEGVMPDDANEGDRLLFVLGRSVPRYERWLNSAQKEFAEGATSMGVQRINKLTKEVRRIVSKDLQPYANQVWDGGDMLYRYLKKEATDGQYLAALDQLVSAADHVASNLQQVLQRISIVRSTVKDLAEDSVRDLTPKLSNLTAGWALSLSAHDPDRSLSSGKEGEGGLSPEEEAAEAPDEAQPELTSLSMPNVSLQCAAPCGAHQGADFSWCPIKMQGAQFGARALADVFAYDPTLSDHHLYDSMAYKDDGMGNKIPVDMGAFLTKDGENSEAMGGGSDLVSGAGGDKGPWWDYCAPRDVAKFNYMAPGTVHNGCQCGKNADLLDRYNPIKNPFFALPEKEEAEADPNGPYLDLSKVPFRDRIGLQIMASLEKPKWLRPDDLIHNPNKSLCVRIASKSGTATANEPGWAYCPVDPSCARTASEHRSTWFDSHSWDFCTMPDWQQEGVWPASLVKSA